MANNQHEEDQIKALLNLSSDELTAQLVDMVAQDESFLQQVLPETEPPSTPEQLKEVFASFNPKTRAEEAIAGLKRIFDRGGDALKSKICVDLRYCERRGHELLKLLRDIAGLLVMAHVIIWHPVSLLAALTAVVWLYKNGYFDKLCDCPKK